MKDKYFLPASVLVAGLLIAGAVLWNGSHPAQQAAQNGTQPVQPTADIKNVNTADNPYIGNANAPITIAFWSDFQCPFCKQFELNTLPQIISTYVNTGKAKVVFLDYPFLGQDSIDAAIYNHAVWKLYPEKYFAWREAMYKAQDAEGDQGFGDPASIDKLNATIPGLDAAKIKAEVAANHDAYLAKATADRDEGSKNGVSATPSFIIGKQLIAGAYPYATFQAALDALLK